MPIIDAKYLSEDYSGNPLSEDHTWRPVRLILVPMKIHDAFVHPESGKLAQRRLAAFQKDFRELNPGPSEEENKHIGWGANDMRENSVLHCYVRMPINYGGKDLDWNTFEVLLVKLWEQLPSIHRGRISSEGILVSRRFHIMDDEAWIRFLDKIESLWTPNMQIYYK